MKKRNLSPTPEHQTFMGLSTQDHRHSIVSNPTHSSALMPKNHSIPPSFPPPPYFSSSQVVLSLFFSHLTYRTQNIPFRLFI
jgi:hypothetical protein